MEKQETIRRLFTSEPYVKSEYQYHRITNKGNVDEQQLHENWTSYLEEYQVISTKYTNTLFDNIYYARIVICIAWYSTIFCYSVFHRKGVPIYTPSGTRTIWSYGTEGNYSDKFICMRLLFNMALEKISNSGYLVWQMIWNWVSALFVSDSQLLFLPWHWAGRIFGLQIKSIWENKHRLYINILVSRNAQKRRQKHFIIILVTH